MRALRFVVKAGSVTAIFLAVFLCFPPLGARIDPLIAAPVKQIKFCNAYCRACSGNRHEINWDSPLWNAWEPDGAHPCEFGDCSSHSCNNEEFAAAIAPLWLKFQKANVKALPALLAANSKYASFNAARGTIQLKCSAGVIVGNLPLTAERAAVLRTVSGSAAGGDE